MTIKLSTLILFVFASAVMGSGVGYSKLYLFHLALVIFTVSFIYLNLLRAKYSILKAPRDWFIYFLYIMFFWYAISAFWSIEPLYTMRYLFYIIIGISIVLLMNAFMHDKLNYLAVFKVLVKFILLGIFIALLESFTPFRLPTSPYSEYAVLFGREGTDFIIYDSSVQMLIKSAPTSFWGNPNNLAVVMTIVFPFFLMHKKRLVSLLGVITVIAIVIMTGSRGSLIACIFGLGIYFFIRGFHYWLPMLILTLLSFTMLTSNIENLKQSENKRISELAWTGEIFYTYLFEDEANEGSISYRQKLIKNGLEALWASDGLGVGAGGSQAVQERSGGVAAELGSMHNYWVEILVDAGVIFFLFYLVWYFTLVYKMYLIFKNSKNSFFQYQSGSLFLSMVIFSISCVSASSVIYLLPMWLMFGLAIALHSLYKKERLYESRITISS